MLIFKQKNKQKKSQKESKKPTLAINKKELAAKKRQAARQRKEIIQAIASFGGIGVVVGIILLFIAGPKLAIAGGGGIAVLILSYKYPREALWGFLIYLPFAGTIVYSIGGGNAIFQLAKDAFYLPALVALIQNCQKKRLPLLIPKQMIPTFSLLLGVVLLTLVFVNGVMQLNPPGSDKPFFQGILGVKVLMGYIPLIPCVYYLIRHKKDLLLFTRLHLVLAIICCALGFLQYWMLKTGICQGTRGLQGSELFKATLDAQCFIGGSLVYSPEVGMIRLPGTFVAPWQWAWFLISNAFFTFAPTFSDPSLIWRILGLAGMALVFVNAVISGQRAALAAVPIMMVILLIITGQVANLKRFIPIGVGLAVLLFIGGATNPDVVQERVDSFISRWNASPPQEFLVNQFIVSHNFLKGKVLGLGVGRATNSTRVFGHAELIETFQPKLLYEIGYPGLFAFQFMVLHLSWITFKAYRSVKDRSLRDIGASFWVFVAFISINPQYYPLDVDPVAVYYWCVAGVILKLPAIARQEEEKLKEAENSQESDKISPHKHKTSDPI